MTGMLSLPAELLVNIAEQVEIGSLRKLRLVCRELRAAAEDRFVQTFFIARHHVLTKFSLMALLAIAKDPHFRPKMRSVHFYLPSTDYRADPHRYDIKQGNSKGVRRLRNRLQAERSAFEENNVGEGMLGEILSLLAGDGNCEHLGLSYVTYNTPYAFGLRTLGKSLGFESREGRLGEELFHHMYAQGIFLDGIAEAGISPTSLTVISPCTYPSAYCGFETSVVDATDSFSRIEKLEFGLDADLSADPLPGYPLTGYSLTGYQNVEYKYIKGILKSSTDTLTDLTIHMTSWPFGSNTVEKNKLRKLTIHLDPESDEQGVIDLLHAQRRSLRHVSLHVSREEEAVFQQFDFISESLKLDVFEYHDSLYGPEFGLKYEGKEAIAAGMRELMEDGDADDDEDDDNEEDDEGENDDGETGDDGDQENEVEQDE